MFLTALLLAASALPTPTLAPLVHTSGLGADFKVVQDRVPFIQDPAPGNSPPIEEPEVADEETEKLPDGIVARIGDEEISLEQYKDELFKIYGYGALTEFLHRRMVRTEAQRLGLVVDPADLEAEWKREWSAMIARARGSEQDVRISLQSVGYTVEQYKSQYLVGLNSKLLENLIIKTLRVPTDAQLMARFHLVYGLDGERVVLRHLMLNRTRTRSALQAAGTPKELLTNDHLDTAIQKKVLELLASARAGDDFETLCRASSHDISVTQNGGVIPNYNFKHYGPDIAAAVHAAPVGEVVGPIVAPAGTHLLKVESRVITEFAKVRNSLHAELMGQEASHTERAALKLRLLSENKIERR